MHGTADAMAFVAQSGHAVGGGGAIRVSGSSTDGLLTSIIGSGSQIELPAAPISLWRRGKMLHPGAGLKASKPIASSGVDAVLGPFAKLSQSWTCAGEESEGPCIETSVQVLQERPVVLWRQTWPRGTSGSPSMGRLNSTICAFPAFSGGSTRRNASRATDALHLGDLGFVTWTGEFAVTPAWRAGRWPENYGRWAGDWPMYSGALSLFDTGGRTLVLGPLSGFTSAVNTLYDGGGLASGPHGMVEELPVGFALETALVLGAGVTAAQMQYGSLLLDAHGKQRLRPEVSPAIRSLMYSADGYPYYDPASGNTTCGNYEDVYLAVSKASREQGLPFKLSMLDSFWYGQSITKGVMRWDASSQCFDARFPHGLPWLRGQLALDFVAHIGTWLKASPYTSSYRFVADPKSTFALPADPKFWVDLLHNATRGPAGWGLSTIKQDHQDQQIGCDWNHGAPRCHRWRGIFEPAVLDDWLSQMAAGAQSQGVTIEYGTTIARFILNTVTLPAVTHARGANDYAIRAMKDAWKIGAASALFWSVGLYTTKDTFFSSSNETAPGGSLRGWHEPYPEMHALVSALSGGPVSPSDAPGAANVSLLMRTCRSDGTLLKPDVPAMPLDAYWVGHAFCAPISSICTATPPVDGELWASATRVGSALVWPLVFASITSNFGLALPAVFAHLKAVPTMHGDGNVAPMAWTAPRFGWVLYRPGAPISHQPPRLVGANATVQLLAGAAYGDFTFAAFAPITGAIGSGSDWALLGETDKFVPVSRQRIAALEADAFAVRVSLIGEARENVTMRLALVKRRMLTDPSIQVVEHTLTLGSDGKGLAKFDVS